VLYIFGFHGLPISSSKQLTGQFNSHLEYTCCILATEAFFAGSHVDNNTLKTYTSDVRQSMEAKGVEIEQKRFCFSIMMISKAWKSLRASRDGFALEYKA
jgi:hypothetical protein